MNPADFTLGEPAPVYTLIEHKISPYYFRVTSINKTYSLSPISTAMFGFDFSPAETTPFVGDTSVEWGDVLEAINQ